MVDTANVLIAGILILGLHEPVSGQPLDNGCAVEGQVVNIQTHAPLQGVTVTLTDTAKRHEYTSESDLDGRFKFADLPPGRYALRAERDGFAVTEGAKKLKRTTHTIVVNAGQTNSSVLVTMAQLGVITGRVLDEYNEPVGRVQVSAFRLSYRFGAPTPEVQGYGSSNDAGEYRISSLSPGRYFVLARPAVANYSLRKRPSGNPIEVLASTYYPDALELSSASRIEVRLSAESREMDIHLRRARLSRVRVRVLGPDGYPLSKVILAVGERTAGSVSYRSPEALETDANGEYELRLPPGTYQLMASSQSPFPLQAEVALTVGNLNLEDRIVIALSQGSDIDGTVRTNGGEVPTGARVVLVGAGDGSIGPSAPVGPRGNFRLGNIPLGDYMPEFFPMPEDSCIESMRYGQSFTSAGPIAVRGSGRERLELVLNFACSRITARVTDRDDRPCVACTVVLVPESHQWNLYRSGTTDDRGTVTLQGVIGGDYKLFACEDIDPEVWHDPEIAPALERRAERLSFKTGEHKVVSLKPLSQE
jgi:hypothetical protein